MQRWLDEGSMGPVDARQCAAKARGRLLCRATLSCAVLGHNAPAHAILDCAMWCCAGMSHTRTGHTKLWQIMACWLLLCYMGLTAPRISLAGWGMTGSWLGEAGISQQCQTVLNQRHLWGSITLPQQQASPSSCHHAFSPPLLFALPLVTEHSCYRDPSS